MFKLRSGKLKNINRVPQKEMKEGNLSSSLVDNVEVIDKVMSGCGDLVKRDLSLGIVKPVNVTIFYLDGMVKKEIINENIIRPLLQGPLLHEPDNLPLNNLDVLQSSLLSVVDVKRENNINELINEILYGSAVMLIEGSNEALLMDSKGWPARGIEEPGSEKTVRGPHEGFTETIRMNTALLRRRIINPALKVENLILGERTHTHICLAYIQGIVNPGLVQEVKDRLNRIKIDAVLDAGYIEQLIEDNPYSPFATVGNTERPDVAAAKVLEGRVVIMVDGSPTALTVPMLFVEGWKSAEDYYSRPYYVGFIGIIRFLAFLTTILAPAVYVAVVTFHQELLPTPLLVTVAASAEGTPFPAVVETVFMVALFQIIREGGIRLPGPVGSALSIVGTLIIGDIAVSAGLVGPPTIIVVATTAVCSFLVVTHTDATVLLNIGLTVLAGMLGGFGIMVGILLILIHLAAIRSFGVPYFSPFMPLIVPDLKDTILRAPLWSLVTRPLSLNPQDTQRMAYDLQPADPETRRDSE